ncbi:MAG: ABC transporter substrate-binding protein [Actinomycetales bacterium]|nr:ABC transporter substrate-binding protein [Actinomycetales bacterium]
MTQVTRMRRPLVAALAGSAAIALALTGCTNSGSTGGPEEVTFSYLWSGAEADAIEQIIADYNASQSDVVVTGISSPDFQKQLTSMSSSNGSFDISDHFGNGVGSWAAKGILAPLDDYLAADGVDTSDFIPAALDQMTYDGKIYSLPIAVHSFQLLYNKTLLEEAGVAVPTTMNELAAAIATLTKQDADGTITQLGLGDPSPSTTLTTLGYNFGGDWDAGGEPSPTEPGNIAALQWYVDNIVDLVGPENLATFNSGNGEYMSAQDPFYVGRFAMVIDGEWRAANIPATAPDLDWGVTAIPYASTDLEDVTQLTASTLFIPANARHKEAAAKFLAYLVSDEGMTAFTKALGNLPSRTSLLDTDAFADIDQFDVWMDALKSPNVFALSSAPYSAEYSADLGTAFGDVILGSTTPQEAMQTVLDNSSNYATE